MNLKEKIGVALGNEPLDLLLINGKIVNVFSGAIQTASVAVHKGIIIGFGEYEAKLKIDLKGAYLAPGFIDGHIHLESSMLAIPELARNIVPLGTTAVITDPHEIANVHGLKGIQYILDSSADLALRVFVMFPSCVPATCFETSGATLGPQDMIRFKDSPRILGLAEMMNFPGVISMDPDVLSKIDVFKDKVKDGHAPGLTGKSLTAYKIAGIGSDHECCTLEEASEKLNLGMRIMIREGSAAKNLDSLLPLVNRHNSRNFMLVSDDLHPDDILLNGHMNYLLKRATSKGLDPVTAIQMVTINPATYFGLNDLGAILPGYKADMVVLEDLENFRVTKVYCSGKEVLKEGLMESRLSETKARKLPPSFNVAWDKTPNFNLKAEAETINVMQVIPEQIVTKRLVQAARIVDGLVQTDTAKDLLKISVIERHHGTGAHGIGMISGFGLKSGAMASSVAHDSHNIVVVGVNDADMLVAAKKVADMGGGLAIAEEGVIRASLPLKIAGLMSDLPIEEVRDSLNDLHKVAKELGCPLEAPFATLSFMALTPIPELKITDQGLFDSCNFKFVSLFDTI